jgi:hypothetical protein
MRKIWRTVTAVLWAFLGIRNSNEAQKDAVTLTPLQIMAVGFLATVLFVVGLILVIKLIVL